MLQVLERKRESLKKSLIVNEVFDFEHYEVMYPEESQKLEVLCWTQIAYNAPKGVGKQQKKA